MAIKLSDQVRSLFSIYTGAVNDEVTFTHLVNNCADMLGQQKVTTEDGQWKCGTGFKLKAKDSHTLQLPPNNPSTPLFYFALRLNEITTAGKFVVNASIPEMCLDYVKQSHIKAHEIAKKLNAQEDEARKKSNEMTIEALSCLHNSKGEHPQWAKDEIEERKKATQA